MGVAGHRFPCFFAELVGGGICYCQVDVHSQQSEHENNSQAADNRQNNIKNELSNLLLYLDLDEDQNDLDEAKNF